MLKSPLTVALVVTALVITTLGAGCGGHRGGRGESCEKDGKAAHAPSTSSAPASAPAAPAPAAPAPAPEAEPAPAPN